MDIALILDKLVPAARYGGSLTDNTKAQYDNLNWEDERNKPSWDDIQSAWVNTEKESNAETVRVERDSRLAVCDWTQLPDSPLADEIKTQWKTYRQALRDVPEQEGFPDGIIWPDEPTA